MPEYKTKQNWSSTSGTSY